MLTAIKNYQLFFLICLTIQSSFGQQLNSGRIYTGAEQVDAYVDYLRGKKVAVVGNQSSVVGNQHLVDTLLALGIQIEKVFGPEHGFRGNASNGEHVSDEMDLATGLPIISLYGSKKKPSEEDLFDIDIVLFDLQDVGCRFFTHINLLRDVMEACAEFDREIMILDRPNPNGYLVDGPVLDMTLKSGIGQFPIPIAHGLTLGEFAKMVIGENWMKNSQRCRLTIISLKNYSHDMEYIPAISPSPNLNTSTSIYLYPSTCLFEGTILNHGRGTHFPFTVLGSPKFKGTFDFNFVPQSIPGMSSTPLFMDETCYGIDLRNTDIKKLKETKKLNLEWLINLYNQYPEKEKFFDQSFSRQIGNIDYLAGTKEFKQQIIDAVSIEEIRASWEPELSDYKKIREKYLLYP
ncbi:MAG: DUF1343 domain-containing protein [Reichenbachiella sp.]|uniref:exo-beta-N-acetylmuramidase NamZ family protein n=1 Tax=Reichenbachiella sp. TaxID=2184521 RepID=UPI0032639E24